jgi:hypothetical protein
MLLGATPGPADEACGRLGQPLGMPPLEEVPPPGARVVPWCDYVGLVRAGAATPLTRHSIRRQRKAQRVRNQANRRFIQEYVAAHPEAAPLAVLARARPRVGPNLARNGDGNWRLTLPSGFDVVTLGA